MEEVILLIPTWVGHRRSMSQWNWSLQCQNTYQWNLRYCGVLQSYFQQCFNKQKIYKNLIYRLVHLVCVNSSILLGVWGHFTLYTHSCKLINHFYGPAMMIDGNYVYACRYQNQRIPLNLNFLLEVLYWVSERKKENYLQMSLILWYIVISKRADRNKTRELMFLNTAKPKVFCSNWAYSRNISFEKEKSSKDVNHTYLQISFLPLQLRKKESMFVKSVVKNSDWSPGSEII